MVNVLSSKVAPITLSLRFVKSEIEELENACLDLTVAIYLVPPEKPVQGC